MTESNREDAPASWGELFSLLRGFRHLLHSALVLALFAAALDLAPCALLSAPAAMLLAGKSFATLVV